MNTFYSELAFDEKNTAVTLSAIAAEYREPVTALINGIQKTGFLTRHPAFLGLYDGISVLGWEVNASTNNLGFELRFTDPASHLSLVFGTSFRNGNQSIHAYLHDRSGLDQYGDYCFLDLDEFCKVKYTDFDNTVDQTSTLSSETSRILGQVVSALEDDLNHFLNGTVALAGTDLSHCSTNDLAATVQKLGDIDLADLQGHTLLCHAVRVGRIDLVQHLLAEGANPNCGAVTLAVNAALDDQVTVALIQALVEAGADADQPAVMRAMSTEAANIESGSPLYAAAIKGRVDVTKCLLRCGAKGKRDESFESLSPAIAQIIGASLGRHRVL